MSFRRYSYADARGAAQGCAHHVLALLEEALSGQDRVTLALSGGSTPKLLFEELVKSRFRWDRVHLLWVDERMVPPTDPQSNYRLAEEGLIRPAHIPARQVHRIHGERDPHHAARAYIDDIRGLFDLEGDALPHIDILQLGMGADAHTASLFPGDRTIDNRDDIAAAVFAEKANQWRVTLLPGVLLAAKHTVFLAAGADKAEAVRTVFAGAYDPMQFPAQLVAHNGRRVAWFLDQAALSLV